MILMIDNYDSFTYNLYQVIAQIVDDVIVVRNDKITIDEIKVKKPHAIILSPGPGAPTESGICMPVIENFSGVIPILGVCLGHQAIVHTFGGKVIRATGVVHGKSDLVFHDGKGIFAGMPQPFAAGRYHSLVADKNTLPDVLTIEAQTQDGIIMAVKHKHHLTFGVQFHPESILTPDGSLLINNFLQIAR